MQAYESNGEHGKKECCKHCGKKELSHETSPDGRDFVCDLNDMRRHASNVKRRSRAREQRAAMRDAMDSIGMNRVRGNLGGTYWE
jgi:hypothetical protein